MLIFQCVVIVKLTCINNRNITDAILGANFFRVAVYNFLGQFGQTCSCFADGHHIACSQAYGYSLMNTLIFTVTSQMPVLGATGSQPH
jgi:hypothetical protein